MAKKFLFFLFVFYIYDGINYLSSEIIPLKKPVQTKEETQKKLLIDVLRPLPKPINKDDVKKMNVEFLNVRYDDNKKLAVIDVKKNKLV